MEGVDCQHFSLIWNTLTSDALSMVHLQGKGVRVPAPRPPIRTRPHRNRNHGKPTRDALRNLSKYKFSGGPEGVSRR